MINLLKRFWRWIAGFVIGGTVLAAGIGGMPADITQPVLAKSIDGKEASINYTDENANEGLIIRTDKQEYFNFAGNVGLYFSIYNSTKEDQNVKIVFSFAKDYAQQVWEYDGEEIIAEIHPAISAVEDKITSTTTIKGTPAIAEYTAYRTETKWKELAKSGFTATAITRKDTKGTKSLEENSVFIKSGETKFLKANIKYFTQGREEFFIEAISETAYGMLDPWTYNQYFNTGWADGADLDTNDSWVQGAGDVMNVGTAYTPYEGAMSVRLVTTVEKWDSYYTRTISDVPSGKMYFAMKKSTTGAPRNDFYVRDISEGNADWWISMGVDGNIYGSGNPNPSVTLVTGFTASAWYVFEVTFGTAASSITARWCKSTTPPACDTGWSAPSAAWSPRGIPINYDTIQMGSNGETIATMGFDTISSTDPTAPAGGEEYFSDDDIISDF